MPCPHRFSGWILGYTSPAATTYISKCQEDGTWSPTDNFRCFPVDCGQPPPVANSSPTTYAVTTFGQNVTVTCLSGFSPLEGITLVCNATGHWEGPALSCEAVDCGQPPQVDLAMVLQTSISHLACLGFFFFFGRSAPVIPRVFS